MLIKDCVKGWYSTVNFIDSNDNFVGFDNELRCCEDWGWFFSRVPGVEDGTQDEEAVGYVWDVQTPPYCPDNYGNSECACVSFRALNTAGEVLWLTLYNSHNGYYSHGWEAPFLNGVGSI